MGQTLDKTMGDRKHLTGHEVERPIAAIKGSRNEKHTVRYTASNPERFEKLWR
jgi:hypothetical protein